MAATDLETAVNDFRNFPLTSFNAALEQANERRPNSTDSKVIAD